MGMNFIASYLFLVKNLICPERIGKMTKDIRPDDVAQLTTSNSFK